MYDPHSLHAEEFIDHEEVQETLAWAAEHARDAGLIDGILAKSRALQGPEPPGSLRPAGL